MKENKYFAKKTKYKGNIYDSKKEAQYAMLLDNEIKKGNIIKYERQIRFDIRVDQNTIAFYKADFKVYYRNRLDQKGDGPIEYWDIKGLKKGGAYQLFRLKKKLVEALYHIKIIEK